MLGICSRKEVGIVGARLFYSDNTLQHAGVGIGGIIAGHLGKDYPEVIGATSIYVTARKI